MPADNLLYYGDNLDILRRHVKDESVDLVYLDPPFNSDANYNVLFAAKSGQQAAAQIQAFEDTWRWDESAARQFAETVEAGGKVADVLLALERFLSTSDMLAYLAMMAPRLIELRRVLKLSGSLYLHCDDTASHYLRILLDAVFGPQNFRNEIIWQRHTSRSVKQAIWPRLHDVLLFYGKTRDVTFQTTRVPSEKLSQPHDLVRGADGKNYRTRDLTGAGTRNGETGQPWRSIDVTAKGRHWRVGHATLEAIDAEGRIHWQSGGMPRERDADPYEPTERSVVVGDVWIDVDALNAGAAERLGYPTQKPQALLDRVISSSSNAGDVVLDPFCGCGTTIEAAQRLGRSWIGIDVTHLAISLIKVRLRDAFKNAPQYSVVGEPTTAEDAAALAASDKYQFQWWALGLVGARPVDQKKGADKGIDGRSYLRFGDTTCQIIFSVKGGKLKATDLRDLRGVVDREKADIGVLLSFETPTKRMRAEAASAGFYKSPWGDHPRLQLLTVAELLAGATVDAPKTAGVNETYKPAPRQLAKVAEPLGLFDSPPPLDMPPKAQRKKKTKKK